jgi:hypothetical protein
MVVSPYYDNFRLTVTSQMASILVALPIYLFVMRLILRETSANPERIESGVRKWLTYIALLVTASGVVGDLVCFVDYFLRGEITLRFALKCAMVLAICGGIFWYYLGFLRGRARSGGFAILAMAGAATAVFLGLVATGTPAQQRHIEADNRRVQDLRSIAGALSAMTTLPLSLPPNLRSTDPETGTPYGYIARSAKEYELCATFVGASERSQYGSTFWSHAKGRACFEFEIARPVPW